mmetsp:Transcript_16640/g.35164  ORF Transcript_16640/g.35164 Transcript_16640/m.35164 type:complete len:426 (+) Transcript_16640:338-1615(+)
MGKKRARPTEEVDASEHAEVIQFAEGQPKFGHRLVSNEKEVRDAAVTSVSGYLKSARAIDALELAKLWKALYYCFWHSDKPKVQRALAEQLAALVNAIPRTQAIPFARAFWETMAREWHGIDRLRLDKYYVLMRCFLRECLLLLEREQWDAARVAELAAMLGESVLHARVAVGLRYFMLDSLLPMLREATNTEAIPAESLLALLEPFVLLMGGAADDHMLQRAISGVVEPLLKSGEEGEAGGEESEKRLVVPLAEVAERLFELASSKATLERNRTALYALQQRVEALAGVPAFKATDGAKVKRAPRKEKAATSEPSAAHAASVGVLKALITSKKKKPLAALVTAPAAAESATDPPAPASGARKKKGKAQASSAEDVPETAPAAAETDSVAPSVAPEARKKRAKVQPPIAEAKPVAERKSTRSTRR